VLLAVLLAVPWIANDYLLTVLIIAPLFRLYRPGMERDDGLCRPAPRSVMPFMVGLGRLCGPRRSTCILVIAPWAWTGPAAIAIAVACGAIIGFSSPSVFGVGRAFISPFSPSRFAEFATPSASIISSGSALRAAFFSAGRKITRATDLWNLRGDPTMFYYVMLALTVAAIRAVATFLLKSRIGYYWLAIREDENCRAPSLGIDTFPLQDVTRPVLSAGMTAVAGVFFAFYYNNFVSGAGCFHISRSIELILGPIIGGYRHAVRPPDRRVSADPVLSEAMQELLSALGFDAPGVKQVFYGLCLLVVVIALPGGRCGPWLAGKLHVTRRGPMTALLSV